MTTDFEVWEARSVGSAWGPVSAADRDWLRALETGVHRPEGTSFMFRFDY